MIFHSGCERQLWAESGHAVAVFTEATFLTQCVSGGVGTKNSFDAKNTPYRRWIIDLAGNLWGDTVYRMDAWY